MLFLKRNLEKLCNAGRFAREKAAEVCAAVLALH